jgi:hypothetical protein
LEDSQQSWSSGTSRILIEILQVKRFLVKIMPWLLICNSYSAETAPDAMALEIAQAIAPLPLLAW